MVSMNQDITSFVETIRAQVQHIDDKLATSEKVLDLVKNQDNYAGA